MKPPFELPLRRIGESIVDAEGSIVAVSLTGEQAEYLVLAINSFEPLVEAVEKQKERLLEEEAEYGLTTREQESLDAVRSVLEAINK